MKLFILLALGSWLILGALFLGYPTMQRLHKHRDQVDWFLLVPIYFALFIGVLADATFNAIWGTIIFRELPREWLFTDRLQRHWNGNSASQKRRAKPWVDRVNLIDPGHVK